MTNAQETNVKQEPLSEQAFLDTLINLCDDLAWGRPASEDRLFALTKEGAGPKNYVRLAEAFGMMLVKVESREYHRSQLIADLKTRNAELEEAHRLLAERNTHLMRTIQENYQTKKIVGQCEVMRKVIQLALTIARRPINTLRPHWGWERSHRQGDPFQLAPARRAVCSGQLHGHPRLAV